MIIFMSRCRLILRFVRFEFPSNEFVNALECVPLETLSTPTGVKDFVAVATTVYRGEDLAVKGAVRCLLYFNDDPCAYTIIQTYVFEVVEVVPDPARSKRRY